MMRYLGALTVGVVLVAAALEPTWAQKPSGILRVHQWDSPPSLSIHEEATIATLVPMMGVFNNLVMYDQHVPQNSMASIVPDLATSWSWSEDGTQLTFRLREGVRWHDGRLLTARDVQCTWDLLLGKASEKLRRQSAQGVVPESRRGHCRRRFDGNVSSETAAAGVDRPVGFRLFAGLPLPCLTA